MTNPLKAYVAKPGDCVLAAEQDEFSERLRTQILNADELEICDCPDRADLIILDQSWKTRNWHDLDDIEGCPFLTRHSRKVLSISHDSISTVFLPGLYVSLTRSNHWRDWAAPCGYKRQYRGIEDVMDNDQERSRQWLFSFRGADFSHPVRRKLTKLYSSNSNQYRYSVVNKKFHSHTQEDHNCYISEVLASHFVLAPRGISPSSYRMYEAMQLGRCPVIISDDWQEIDGVDWGDCTLRVKEKDIAHLVHILRDRVADADSMGRAARRAWEDNFADGIREAKMIGQLLAVHKNARYPRDINSLKKLWHSWKFRIAHGWTIGQRLHARSRCFFDSDYRFAGDGS